MQVVLLQLDIQWKDIQENIRRAEMLMGKHPGADLYVLPEMWSTGFLTDIQEGNSPDDVRSAEQVIEHEQDSIALRWMQEQARRCACALSGSLAVRLHDGSCRNRHYFMTPDHVFFYDKHHLFSYGHEDDSYQAGQTHTVVAWKEFRFLLLTCYDLRFPVWSRYGLAGEYDAIIYVANWPSSRIPAWDVLTKARAIENQCYVIAVNRVGDDPLASYCGHSMVIDPIGRVVVESDKNTEQALFVPLSKASLDKARTRFRVLADRDIVTLE
ncbi:MAG: nitrilase family protein [Prevotella sp.]|nr:nitrilase family protein [Prevotella sp.]